MLDTDDLSTHAALRLFYDIARDRSKPIIFWLGAGVSAWNGYPLWPSLAETVLKQVRRCCPMLKATEAANSLKTGDYPSVFEACQAADSESYYRILLGQLGPRETNPVFERLLRAINRLGPAFVLTTNADEGIDRALPKAQTILPRAIELAHVRLTSRQPFVCKLHGSTSDPKSLVFTTGEYRGIASNNSYAYQLSLLFSAAHLVFIGYGLADEYVLGLLSDVSAASTLLGDGPHFLFSDIERSDLPRSVRVIRYSALPHRDHRDPIGVLEEASNSQSAIVRNAGDTSPNAVQQSARRSIHLLSDLLLPGTRTTSQTLSLEAENGHTIQAIVGMGFSDEELPHKKATAIHDVAVGLLCFDEVMIPTWLIAATHDILGSANFWRLSDAGALSFLHGEQRPALIYPSADSPAGGDIGLCSTMAVGKHLRSLEEVVKAQIHPVNSHDKSASKKIEELIARTASIPRTAEDLVPQYTRHLLLRPSIRSLLGISEGTPANSIPRWNAFSILRLAHVVSLGLACHELGVSSTRIPFGMAELAGPVFSVTAASEWADSVASYVVSGQFAFPIEYAIHARPELWSTILAFRHSTEGQLVRDEVRKRLDSTLSADLGGAINGALRSGIPTKILQQARNHWNRLLTATAPTERRTTAVWSESLEAEANSLALWRARSRSIREDWCRKANISAYDSCPCGSGERLKFCCEAVPR